MTDLFNAVIVGTITGIFTGGTVWGVLKTELKFMRRDINELRNHVWPARNGE